MPEHQINLLLFPKNLNQTSKLSLTMKKLMQKI